MNKYIYLGNSNNLNHRGYPTDTLYEITVHEDCFYVKVNKQTEARLEIKYLKNFILLSKLVEQITVLAEIEENIDLITKTKEETIYLSNVRQILKEKNNEK